MIKEKTPRAGFRACLAAVLCALTLVSACFGPAYAAEIPEAPVITSGNLVVVRSVDTSQVLMSYGGDKTVAPTVSAKLMAAMVAYDLAAGLDKVVSVPAEALLKRNIGEKGDLSAPLLGLATGETYTVKQLLTATLVSAANDACYTLAHFVSGGDVSLFVSKMNEKAASFGCTNTLFTTPVGLNDGEAHTTPLDVSLIAAAFYKYNTLLEISSQPTYVLGSTIHTKNYLLSDSLLAGLTVPGAKGMIAGQARNADGYCLITAAENAGLGYVFVIMEAPGEVRTNGTRSFPAGNAYEDAKKLFAWAPKAFGYIELCEEREIIGELEVDVASENTDHVSYVAANAVEILMPLGTKTEDIKRETVLSVQGLEAPVEKNMKVGRLDFVVDGVTVASVDLVTNAAVERSRILAIFGRFRSFVRSSTMKSITRILIAVIIAYLIFVLACFVYRNVARANAAAQRLERQKAAKLKAKESDGKNNTSAKIAAPKPEKADKADENERHLNK